MAATMNLTGVPKKFHYLLLTIQNSTDTVWQLHFPDEKTARSARIKFSMDIKRHPTWFNLLLSVRGTDVYVVKLDRMKKVVIEGG